MGRLGDFFNNLEGWGGYFFLFLSSFGENLFPPLPGDTFVVLGAFMVGRDQLNFFPAYLATTTGSILGFMVLYFIGFRLGKAFVEGKSTRLFSQERFNRVLLWFNRYGYWVIGFNRFLSGFRSVVSFGAGIVRMDVKIVFGLGLLSCVVWNGIIMGVGIWIGENWIVIVQNYQKAVFIVVLIIVSFLLVKTHHHKRGQS